MHTHKKEIFCTKEDKKKYFFYSSSVDFVFCYQGLAEHQLHGSGENQGRDRHEIQQHPTGKQRHPRPADGSGQTQAEDRQSQEECHRRTGSGRGRYDLIGC